MLEKIVKIARTVRTEKIYTIIDINCIKSYPDRGLVPKPDLDKKPFSFHNILMMIAHAAVRSIPDSDLIVPGYRMDHT
jgi:hypothetical protein